MLQQMHAVRNAPPPDAIAAAVIECDRQWQERLERYAEHLRKSWEKFENMVTVIDDELAGEVSEDEWGDLSASFKHLQRIGVRFDPLFIERFEGLNPVPDAFDPKDPCKGARTGSARTSESFVEDDDYEHGGDGAQDDNEDDDPAGGEEWH